MRMISSSLQSECEDEVLFVVLVCRHLCYGWQSRHRLLTAKHRISSLQQIESEMVLKTCKKVKTCQEKANIWLRVSFDLYCIWMAGLTTNIWTDMKNRWTGLQRLTPSYLVGQCVVIVWWPGCSVSSWCRCPLPVRTVGSEITGHALE